MLKYLLLAFFVLTSPALANPTEIAFGADARQTLDAYAATASCTGGCPVLVWVHGGGWRHGDKSMRGARNIAATWTAAGVTVVTLNYRLTPDVVHPAHIQDVAAGVAWTKRNIARFGGNPDRLFIMGHSAGAHLVALLGTNKSYLGAYGLDPARDLDGVFSIDTASYDLTDRQSLERPVRSMVDNAFGTDPAALADASPLQQVKRGQSYPPFIIAVVKQRANATEQCRKLESALQRVGASAQMIVVDYASDPTILSAHGHIARDLADLNLAMTKQLYQTVMQSH